MTSDTERPRQRTVAELLAEHGDTAAPSRRRRRRAPDDEPAEAFAPDGGDSRPIVAQRTSSPTYPGGVPDASSHPYFEPGDNDRREAYRVVSRPDGTVQRPGSTTPRSGASAWSAPPASDPRLGERQRAARSDDVQQGVREFSTDVMPRIAAAPAAFDPGADTQITGPIPLGRQPEPVRRDTGPIAVAGVAPAGVGRPATAPDGGPPTQFSPGVVDDDPDDYADADPIADEWADDDWSDDEWVDDDADAADGDPAEDADGRYDAPSAAEVEYDDDLDDELDLDDQVDDEDDLEVPERQRAAPNGPTWPAVIAQWIAGAIGGAALWVGFRFLWKGYPIVAIAAALAVTIGLVVIVRALLRAKDVRTTIFAVLVGLLLTASPAILVLIGR